MEELVARLKQAREEKNISLDEISCQTRIQLRYLEALEKGNFTLFAGEVYLKGVICNYAAAVGLERKEVLDQYDRLKAKTGENPPYVTKPDHEASRPKQIRRVKGNRKKRRLRQENKGPSLSAAVIVLLLTLIGFGIWYSWNIEQPDLDRDLGEQLIDPPEENQKPDDDEPILKPEPQPEVAVVSATLGETIYSVSGPEELKLELDFTANCWVELVIDGAEPFDPRTFQAGEEYTVAAAETIFLRMGNPPAVRVKVNSVELTENQTLTRPHNFRINLE